MPKKREPKKTSMMRINMTVLMLYDHTFDTLPSESVKFHKPIELFRYLRRSIDELERLIEEGKNGKKDIKKHGPFPVLHGRYNIALHFPRTKPAPKTLPAPKPAPKLKKPHKA